MKMTTSASPFTDPKEKTVMGYPSMDRYHQTQFPQMPPGYPTPCQPQPYSSSFHNHQGNYPNYALQNQHSSSSFNGYYYQQPYQYPMMPQPKSTSFGRVMLIMMVVLISGMCTMSLVMWFLFGTYIPQFYLSSLNVSNLTTTNSTVTGRWDANITIFNANENLEIHFNQIRSSVFYRESIIGISNMQPFVLQKNEKINLNVSVNAENLLHAEGPQSIMLPALARDRENGIVFFSLRLAFNANFSSNDVVYRKELLRVLCENLQVSFSPTGEGSLTRGSGSECLIRIRDIGVHT